MAALTIAALFAAFLTPSPAYPQQPTLASVTAMRCSFTIAVITPMRTEPFKPETRTPNLTLEFETINADEGTAQLKSLAGGKFDIIVRNTKGYLHFIQAFFEGPLYVTTILDRKAASGKWKAMHSRHEYTDVALTGYTSSPEQYYGECEALK
jgi:hypothetical protein